VRDVYHSLPERRTLFDHGQLREIEMDKQSPSTTPPPCDCCGSFTWEYLFTEAGIDLGKCMECGLHYIAQMPQREQRITEMEAGHFADGQVISNARLHLQSEHMRQRRFQAYVGLTRRFAPSGKWLDMGCGSGTLIQLAQEFGIDAEGIELTPDRRALARQVTGAVVYEYPLEALNFPPDSFAAVILINVFSHLTSPSETLAHIHRVLCPGGVVLLLTGEIGLGVRKHHVYSWALGNHLYFLGDSTIDRYANKLKFQLVYRDKTWQPAATYTRERFKIKGRSKLRNLVKIASLYTPGVFPLLRWYMLSKKHAGNPIYTSTLLLKKG
jgi:SAM-dependent methyltransferase